MPVCGSGAVVSPWSLLIRRPQRACRQAETPLIVLFRFPGPALTSIASRSTRPGIASETDPPEFAAKPRYWPVPLLSTLCTLLFLTGAVMAQAGWHPNDLTSG